MIVFPNAKINLGLYVTEKRSDGYHNIETLFLPVKGLKDVLEVLVDADQEDDVFMVSGTKAPGIESNNTVLKALQLTREKYAIPPLKIHLHKTIPAGAGLGGGSADGAFMLHLLNQLLKLQLSHSQLKEMAVKLGADCAFFIQNEPALACGIGDELTPFDPGLTDRWLTIVVPPVHISTPAAYGAIAPTKPNTCLKKALLKDAETWQQTVTNDFEKFVFSQFPDLQKIKEKLYDQGATYASLSGSGSAFFGIFEEEPHIEWPEEYFSWKGKMPETLAGF